MKITKYPSGAISCSQAVEQIKSALKRRSGKRWSVTTSRGTGYGWIRVTAIPSRQKPPHSSHMSPEDTEELRQLFNVESYKVGSQGLMIASREEDYQEYIDRAEGNEPIVLGRKPDLGD